MLRALLVYGIASSVILGVFFIFVIAGWPGPISDCINETPNDGCFCESFDINKVEQNEGGIRQMTNTLSNLYSLGTALIVALVLGRDRKIFAGRAAPNIMRSSSIIADFYLFAVLFLGLGSMWFHASMKAWGSTFDGLSMYIYAAFLVFYTMIRLYGDRLIFYIGYPTIVVTMTAFHAAGVPSFALIIILVVFYLLLEVRLWFHRGSFAMGRVRPVTLWIGAALSMGWATVFWKLSESGGAMCDPDSWFQPHGLFWHTLAGVMALLLFFYWREEDVSEPVLFDRRTGPPHHG